MFRAIFLCESLEAVANLLGDLDPGETMSVSFASKALANEGYEVCYLSPMLRSISNNRYANGIRLISQYYEEEKR